MAGIDLTKEIETMRQYADTTNSDKYAEADIDTSRIIMSKTYGKAFNCGNAAKYVSRYMTEGFPKSNNPEDIKKAIHYLLFELKRIEEIKDFTPMPLTPQQKEFLEMLHKSKK